MLKNYLKIAFRNLKKFRVFSVINITGLSISLAVVFPHGFQYAHQRGVGKGIIPAVVVGDETRGKINQSGLTR